MKLKCTISHSFCFLNITFLAHFVACMNFSSYQYTLWLYMPLVLPFSGNEYKFLFIVLSAKRDGERFNCRKGKESKFHRVIFQKSEVEVKNDDLYGKCIVRIHPCFTCKKVNNIQMTEIKTHAHLHSHCKNRKQPMKPYTLLFRTQHTVCLFFVFVFTSNSQH